MSKNEHKLPLFHQQSSEELKYEEKKVLSEFITCCFLDPQFPSFVNSVENITKDLLND